MAATVIGQYLQTSGQCRDDAIPDASFEAQRVDQREALCVRGWRGMDPE